MNILMMSNTYKPIVGGLERSIEILVTEFRRRGHQVMLVSPEMKGAPEEEGVFRIPAIQHFNGTDFSVELPVPMGLSAELNKFNPDIVHSHHPFLIGDTALRVASKFNVPIVFTYHTLYEEYIHYVPGNNALIKKFVIELAKGYCELCDHVIAPSDSVAALLKSRGVKTSISVIPSGIYFYDYMSLEPRRSPLLSGIPENAFIVGTAGRIAPEKNIDFLTATMIAFLKRQPQAYFMVIGDGPLLKEVEKRFINAGLSNRFIATGTLTGGELASGYRSLDAFVFASHSETQGLVVVEAMSSGVPVVAIDASGVREVVKDRKNGRLIAGDDEREFVAALEWVMGLSEDEKNRIKAGAREKGREFSIDLSVEKILTLFSDILLCEKKICDLNDNLWRRSARLIKTEKNIMVNLSRATGGALHEFPRKLLESVREKAKEKTKN
ncbi:MAG: glycosyltransferase [Candidatus Omnitrophota bacterium]